MLEKYHTLFPGLNFLRAPHKVSQPAWVPVGLEVLLPLVPACF